LQAPQNAFAQSNQVVVAGGSVAVVDGLTRLIAQPNKPLEAREEGAAGTADAFDTMAPGGDGAAAPAVGADTERADEEASGVNARELVSAAEALREDWTRSPTSGLRLASGSDDEGGFLMHDKT
jgi:hypothetical protein